MRIKIGKFEDSEKGGGKMDDRKTKAILEYLIVEKEGWDQSYEGARRKLDNAYTKKSIEEIIAQEKNVEFFKGRLMESSAIKTAIEKILGA